jgi:pimeloyl-ACP methyl ester carboxylesterase
MATFVLVHGTGCGGWIWKKLSPLLRERGHDVYTPTLTGLAERDHVRDCNINLTTHVTDIANLIFYEDLNNVILVGNSYAGMVITGVANKIPERLKLLVYLDAYLPDDGQSEADLLPAGMFSARRAEAAQHNGLLPPPSPTLFGITDPVLVGWVKDRMTPHPIDTYTEPVFTNEKGAAVPAVFIHCTANPPGTPDLFASSAAKARTKGWQVIDLETGHLAMLTAPMQLAHILLSLLG